MSMDGFTVSGNIHAQNVAIGPNASNTVYGGSTRASLWTQLARTVTELAALGHQLPNSSAGEQYRLQVNEVRGRVAANSPDLNELARLLDRADEQATLAQPNGEVASRIAAATKLARRAAAELNRHQGLGT